METQKIIQERKAYRTLCAEYYDLFRPGTGKKEVAFYRDLIDSCEGPAHEAMCGSGRLLIPLLEKGYRVDGSDYSDSMIDQCRKRCQDKGLSTELFVQPVECLELPHEYGCIFIAIGSIQHIQDPNSVVQAFSRIRKHLRPDGRLAVDCITPWGLIKEGIDGTLIDTKPRISSHENEVEVCGGTIKCVTESTTHLPTQLAISKNQYQKYNGGQLVAVEDEEIIFRWYYRYEMQLMLEKAGFQVTEIVDKNFEPGLHSTVLIAKPC